MEVLFEFADKGEIEFIEIQSELEAYKEIIDKVEISLMLSKPEDSQDTIVSIHPGAGGTESQDWAQMLQRMYVRWAESQENCKVILLQEMRGEEAGIKSCTLKIIMDYSYGWLKAESGIHRLVRISPFDSNKRRHTSFAGVDVVPLIDDSDEFDLNDDDIRIDVYRSSGAGGQHVNTTDSAVRVTHIPTGIVVACQAERSQLQNKIRALALLKSKLILLEKEEKLKKLDSIRGEQVEAGWGRQIRSYVMQPYQQVKDSRTNIEVGNIQSVLDGDINIFINEYLKWRRQGLND